MSTSPSLAIRPRARAHSAGKVDSFGFRWTAQGFAGAIAAAPVVHPAGRARSGASWPLLALSPLRGRFAGAPLGCRSLAGMFHVKRFVPRGTESGIRFSRSAGRAVRSRGQNGGSRA